MNSSRHLPRGPMSQEHKAKISAGMVRSREVAGARPRRVVSAPPLTPPARRKSIPLSLAKRPITKLSDAHLIELIVAQSELSGDVQREMIQSTLDLHVAMKGPDAGHEIWRASMQDICRRGRVEIEAANATPFLAVA